MLSVRFTANIAQINNKYKCQLACLEHINYSSGFGMRSLHNQTLISNQLRRCLWDDPKRTLR